MHAFTHTTHTIITGTPFFKYNEAHVLETDTESYKDHSSSLLSTGFRFFAFPEVNKCSQGAFLKVLVNS